jgi:hypothetical protein
MQDFERLGVFYLGREYDLATRRPTDELLLYDAKDLTTHAVCVGMTGSGKTGLCLALLEEAGIDNIPAIIIDPKGDLANLLLTFPQLRAEDFQPWIDADEARRQGKSVETLAAETAKQWRDGLVASGQTPERIQRLRDAVDIAIYTPGSSAGLQLSVLRSFDAPPESTRSDSEALRGAVSSAASALLGLLEIEADPLKSREHILLSNILDRAWREGQSLDIAALIRAIQSPPFDKIGVVDLESFFPAKERFELAMQLNNLLASPGFAAWTQGEPLDVQRLLYTEAGKPRLSILSIAHLSDAERMFFVTLLLGETIGWMRQQSGTSSLRALLYMDEVFGYFPPTKNPPSKQPMLTLLKQARAFGLGIVLATQNPVDLDYKGLANCGTWFLGRLQTERDKLRVLDGLEGASEAAGASFDRAKMDRILSGLGQRVFLMNNVHEDHPVVLQSRWALSYLRGPLSREQISRLMADRRTVTRSVSEAATPARSASEAATLTRRASEGVSPPGTSSASPTTPTAAAIGPRPVLPPDITERFVPSRAVLSPGQALNYRPALLGQARLHFTQASTGVDAWQDVSLLLAVEGQLPTNLWESAEEQSEPPELEAQPAASASFADLPAELSRPKRYSELATALKDYLYRHQKLHFWKCPSLKATSNSGESQADFRIRLTQQAREARDEQVEALRQKYAPKVAALDERIRKANLKLEKEKSQATEKTISAALSVGASILGALFSRKLASSANVTRAATGMRQASRIARERQDVNDANESMEVLQQQKADLEAELRTQTEQVQTELAPDKLPLEEVVIQPKKSDIRVSPVTLIWLPASP